MNSEFLELDKCSGVYVAKGVKDKGVIICIGKRGKEETRGRGELELILSSEYSTRGRGGYRDVSRSKRVNNGDVKNSTASSTEAGEDKVSIECGVKCSIVALREEMGTSSNLRDRVSNKAMAPR